MAYLRRHSEFHRRRSEESGVPLECVESVPDLTRFPFTEKQELRESPAQQPPLGWHRAAAAEDTVQIQASSGTTGSPSYVGLTWSDQQVWNEMGAHAFYVNGLHPGDRSLHAFGMNKGFVGGLPLAQVQWQMGVRDIPIGTEAGAKRILHATGRPAGIEPDQVPHRPGRYAVGWRAEIVSAVAETGVLGFITALTQPTPEALVKEIARTRDMTDHPFGVNLTILPAINPTRCTGGRSSGPSATTPPTTSKSSDPLGSRSSTSARACATPSRPSASALDAVSIDGFECAGHPGEEDVPGLVLIPRGAEELSIPFIASGGFADAHGLVTALALGADGINMGTRFMATVEAPIRQRVEERIVGTNERDTELISRTLRNTSRVATNGISREAITRLYTGAQFEEVRDLVAGARGPGPSGVRGGRPRAGHLDHGAGPRPHPRRPDRLRAHREDRVRGG
ncbi:nitronate monooxygenase [Brevibacterium spongiae]|uniref:nitronate monooxygenase n=1 Tax=Brevibacterium spongiae TaxID=2909672 RepID=UPI0024B4E23B|nr:nitronate monooxygenase [Brevibacterium spongiae]